MEIGALQLYLSLFREKQRSRLRIAVLHKVWVVVKNVSYMGVGKAWFCRSYCCGRLFSQINESLDTWQVPVCKSLGRRSRHCSEYRGLFLSTWVPTGILAKREVRNVIRSSVWCYHRPRIWASHTFWWTLQASRDDRWEEEWLVVISICIYPSQKISKVFFAFPNSTCVSQ